MRGVFQHLSQSVGRRNYLQGEQLELLSVGFCFLELTRDNMAQWAELLGRDLLQGHLSQVYERRFPRHIRHSLCHCIESQDWDAAAVDESKAQACFLVLMKYLDEQWTRSVQESNGGPGPDFPGMKDYLMRHFEEEPLNLAVILCECLQEEKKILASASPKQRCHSPVMEQKWRQLDNRVNELQQQTLELKKQINSLEVLYGNYDYIEKTWASKADQYVGLVHSHDAVKDECLKQAGVIELKKQNVHVEIESILKKAEHMVSVLRDVELPEWRRRQMMSCIGCPVDTSLDLLQNWFTAVTKVLLQVRQQLQKLQEQNNKYNNSDDSGLLNQTDTFALTLLTLLLTQALVVEKQPVMTTLPQRPQILKTTVRFTLTVRFLANLPEFQCLLKVKPVLDKDVEETLIANGLRQFEFQRDDSKVLDVDSSGRGLVAEFAPMSVKEIKGTPKRCEARVGVTEELHIIKFVTAFHFAGVSCNIEASTLPIVIVSSTNQIPSAWAAVMWSNMLSTTEPWNLLLLADPSPLPWQQLAQVLSWQFLSVGQRGLDENQLSMLRDKIVDNPDALVHWNKFKGESAWIWIDGILDLIKKHLIDLWRDGSIMGFVSRKWTQMLLKQKPTGTFLLRFSESNKDGAITFSWVEQSAAGEAHVHAVEPYTKKDLSNMSLPDIIYLYSLRAQGSQTRNPLLYLYPDTHRDDAFGRYRSSETLAPKKDVNGYIERRLVPFSVHPTPPPSPPQNMDVDPDSAEEKQKIQELLEFLMDPSEAQSSSAMCY